MKTGGKKVGRVEESKLSILIKIKGMWRFEDFLEKRIIPLKEKYPYVDIRIEVEY